MEHLKDRLSDADYRVSELETALGLADHRYQDVVDDNAREIENIKNSMYVHQIIGDISYTGR